MRCTGSSVSYLASHGAKLSTATSWPFTTFCLLAALTILNIAPAAFAQDQPKRLVALLDYLGSDYKNAVRDGKVLSQDEYGEMQEFSRRSLDLFKQLKEATKGKIHPLHLLINIMSMTVFPFIASPLLQNVGNLKQTDFDHLMEERKKMIPIWFDSIMKGF